MKITIDLPESDYSGHPGYEPDGSLSSNAPCAGCGEELYGLVVRLHPLGWLHAEREEDRNGKTCQELAVEKILADPATAWAAAGKHVAKYPSKHTSATVRAVITELAKLTEKPLDDDLSAEVAMGHLAAKLQEIHYPVDGNPADDGSCIAEGDDWPCPTMRALYVNEAVRAGA